MRWKTAFVSSLLVLCTGALAQSPARAQEKPAAPAAPAATVAPAAETLPSVQEVMDKLDDLYRSTSSHGTVEMTIVNARGTRKLTIEMWTKGEEKALIVIRQPAREAGTATLKLEDGLWNYAPRADRLIRVPSGLLSDSWMGSDFTNDDLMRETSLEKDFTTTLSWASEGGTKYLQATMTPRPDAPVVWDKIVYRLTEKDWLPVDARFYDKGKLVRTMTFSNIRDMGGRSVPTVMTLQPENQAESTRMEYKDLKFDVKIDDSLFSQQGLRRMARTK